jgi:hypothetical protein
MIFFKIEFFLSVLYEDINQSNNKTGIVHNANIHIIIAQVKKLHDATLDNCIA